MSEDPSINKTYFKKYLCQEKIGKGSFGVVYSGTNTTTKEKVALKLEKREEIKGGTLEMETYRLICLQGEGIPKVHCYGKNQTHYILIQELLGYNLEDLFATCRKQFSLKTTCVLGIEMLKRISFVHSNHHIHRDIKPENFMFGRNEHEETLYLIDFGLSKKYFSATRNEHIKFCTGKYLTGTARYCARNAHKGYEQSRRDDLESIGYVLMYFLLGSLPWQGLKLKPGEEHFDKIAEKKEHTSFSKLCQGQPSEFVQWFRHVDGLAFDERPNYDYLIGLFQEIINRHCSNWLYDFDWKKLSQQRLSVEKENKSRNVSILVNNVNGHSTLNESHLGNNEYKEDKFNNNNIFEKDEQDKENDVNDNDIDNNNENEKDTESPEFNASPILHMRKLKKQDLNEDSIDQLKHINKKRNNSYKQLTGNHKRKVSNRKDSSPVFKQNSQRKTSQPLFSETEKNFGLLVRELNEKKKSDELKYKEGSDPKTLSDLQFDNDNTKVMQRNSITSPEKTEDKSNLKQSSKCKFNINDLNGKDLTKCACVII